MIPGNGSALAIQAKEQMERLNNYLLVNDLHRVIYCIDIVHKK